MRISSIPLLALSLLLGAQVWAAETVSPLPFAAHRAVYDLTLAKSTGSSAPVSARGRIVFDFSGSACDGFCRRDQELAQAGFQQTGIGVCNFY
jgi:hypothetical protein